MTQTTTINNDTIVTTTTNYSTDNGTNANGGGSNNANQGEPSDGSGGGDGDDGDSDDGTASGGGDCDTPPITTGDPVMGMVATQAWHTRCAVEAGNAAKVTGDVGDCSEPFTVDGNNANAHQLRALRAEICKGDSNGNGQPDYLELDGEYQGDPEEGEGPNGTTDEFTFGPDMLDQGGLLGGGGSCPSLGAIDFGFFGSIDFDSFPYWCNLVSIMRAVVLLVGAFTALRLLMGDSF
ncbi:hypothetical protein FKV24_008055 [Lysobacter maris]|uniref:Uncharacterized protein n=1 Tax=Marilutibacter maris TaxID=1605891 RepID=A0A508AVN3_9GAMM|nr:hypothetical protein FKV24_008055 [Lysobacter maris]